MFTSSSIIGNLFKDKIPVPLCSSVLYTLSWSAFNVACIMKTSEDLSIHLGFHLGEEGNQIHPGTSQLGNIQRNTATLSSPVTLGYWMSQVLMWIYVFWKACGHGGRNQDQMVICPLLTLFESHCQGWRLVLCDC